MLRWLYDWLATSEVPRPCDVVFVLAGRECRKVFGLQLLNKCWTKTLLLSVGRFEVRRFSSLKVPADFDLAGIASAVEPRYRHYFVTMSAGGAEAARIPIGRLGTMSEIRAFSAWLKAHPAVRSVTVVSSGFHLRRIRMCCRRMIQDGVSLTFAAVPDEGEFSRDHWWRSANARRLVISELAKLAIYKLLGGVELRRARGFSGVVDSREVPAG